MPDNAAKRAMNQLAPDESYNFLTGGVNRVLPNIAKSKKKIQQYIPPSGATENSFEFIWRSASPEQKRRWLAGGGEGTDNENLLFLLDMWNSGQIDGMKHKSSFRDIVNAVRGPAQY